MFLVNSLDLFNVSSVSRVNFLLACLFTFFVVLSLNSLAHNSNKINIPCHEQPCFPVAIDYRWELYFVDPQSQFLEVPECPEQLMLVNGPDRVHRVIILKGVFDKTFPVFDEYPQLILNCNCSLLKTSGKHVDIFARFHQPFHIATINSLYPPQPQHHSCNRHHQHSSTRQSNSIFEGTIGIVGEDGDASRQNSVRIEPENATFIIGYLFLIDNGS